MISGTFYQGSAIQLNLQTDIILGGSTPVSIMAKKPNGDVIEIHGIVVDITSIRADLTAETNDQAGQWLLQAKAEMEDGQPVFGQTEKLFIQIPFAETPEP